MTGVTWDERKPGDWLASNGRWYPEHQRPRGWTTLALPPAPGHGGASQLHSTIASKINTAKTEWSPSFSDSDDDEDDFDFDSDGADSFETTASGVQPSRVARPRPTAANATATNVRTYKHRIERGPAAPAQLPPPSQWRDKPAQPPAPRAPAPPGRVLNEPASPPPPPRSVPARRSPSGNAGAQSPTAAGYASDLGRVLGKARKRIEEAIEESAQAGNDR